MAILDDVKASLRVTHNSDDALLTRLIESATLECVHYLNLDLADGATSVDLPENVINGVILLVQADYEGDMDKRDIYAKAAQRMWDASRDYAGLI